MKWLVLEDSFLKWTRYCHTMMNDLKPKKLDKSKEVGTCHPLLIVSFYLGLRCHTNNTQAILVDCLCC
jgi:hypothetical protein